MSGKYHSLTIANSFTVNEGGKLKGKLLEVELVEDGLIILRFEERPEEESTDRPKVHVIVAQKIQSGY